jgi:hypothetical protein
MARVRSAAVATAVVVAAGLGARTSAGAGADGGALCQAAPATSIVVPLTGGGPFDPQTTAVFDVVVTNHDAGGCDPRRMLFIPGAAPPGFTVLVAPTGAVAGPGGSASFALAVTGTTTAAAGTYRIPFRVDAGSGQGLAGEVTYQLAPPGACLARPDRELLINDVSVVDDPVRTVSGGPTVDRRAGAWTFGRLMQEMAPASVPPGAFVEDFLRSWLSDQSIGGFTVAARPAMAPFLLDRWPRDAGGLLDLQRAPLRLLAIVNRMDVRSLARGDAGQGRFVFGVIDPAGRPAPFTVILEYDLPAACSGDVVAWARAWHALGSLPFPSETYNSALQALTERFTSRGSDPRRPNGSALRTARTDEAALDFVWELRQFGLSDGDGLLEPQPVDLTPDIGFQVGSPLFADFVNENEQAILADRYVVPPAFEGMPFQAGSSFNVLEAWRAPGIANPEARHLFSLGTCNGCHGMGETGTEFLHVSPRAPGAPSGLSGFLKGLAVADPVTGEIRTFNDLQRRKADLEQLVCACTGNVAEGAHRIH